MPNPVVITRPLAQAGLLAERVAALGRESIVFPLLEIHPLADFGPFQAVLDNLSDYALVAFVSPNAIDATFAYLKSWPKDVALAIVGEGSRATLAKHGITDVNATIYSPHNLERTDSETLLQALDIKGLRSKRALIIRGETGRELLANALRAAGIEVTLIAAYKRAAPQINPTIHRQLRCLLDSKNDWIVTSSEALRILLQLVESIDDKLGVVKMKQKRLLVPHFRIAETAKILGFENVTLTGSGDERLLAALQS